MNKLGIINIFYAIPEIALSLTAMFSLIVGAFLKKRQTIIVTVLMILAMIGCIYFYTENNFNENIFAFNNLFVSNRFIVNIKLLLQLLSIVFFLLYLGQIKQDQSTDKFEFIILASFAIIGMMLLISSNNFMSMYVAIELQALVMYVLASFNRDNLYSSEAGVKYFVLGALASGILLFGVSLIYGFSGSLTFSEISSIFASGHQISFAMKLGVLLVILGLFFKISAAPLHIWTPDVYQGSPTIVTTFFATIPKLALIGFITKLLAVTFELSLFKWKEVVILMSILSMYVGSIAALKQKNIKRLLAYSSIGHIGFILAAIASMNFNGIKAIITYMVIYVIMSFGMFASILLLQKNGSEINDIDDLKGLYKNNPLLAFFMSVLLFSMAGIPPLAGFLAKFYVFISVVDSELYFLAVFAVVASVIAAFYYIRIVKFIYFDEAKGDLIDTKSVFIWSIFVLSGIFNLLFFIYPDILLDYSSDTAKIIFYGQNNF